MHKILYLILLTSQTVCGQGSLNAEINNTNTSKHIHIPGTRLYIVPPQGYKVF